MGQQLKDKMSTQDIKRERFVRIAEQRVNRILDVFDKLGKCSDKRNYKYNEGDVKIIFNEIEKKVKDTKILFDISKERKKTFRLR